MAVLKNKKGGVNFQLVLYIVAILTAVALIWINFGDTSVFKNVKVSAEGLKEYVPNVTEGIDPLKAGKPTIPEGHRKSLVSLKERLNTMSTSKKNRCFGKYTALPDLGEKGTSIEMTYDLSTDSTNVVVFGGASGKQVMTDLLFTVKGMKPCVIAKSSTVTSNFVSGFLNTKNWTKKVIDETHYWPVNSLIIKYQTTTGGLTGGLTCFNGNTIRVPEFGSSPVNNRCDNFEDNGYLYTPDNRHICFFPTNYNTNANEDGIDNGYLLEGEGSIPHQLSTTRTLQWC